MLIQYFGMKRSLNSRTGLAVPTLVSAALCWLVSIQALPAVEEPKPYPDMAQNIGEIIQGDYYDSSRIDPEQMVQEAIRSLERAHIAVDVDWSPPEMVIRVASSRVTIPAAKPHELSEAMQLLDAIRIAIQHERFDESEQRALEYALMNGALQSLDPHTLIFPPEPADVFAEEIEGQFFGIGAYLNQNEGLTRIERVMPNFPAEKAGILDGDIILGVDDEKITGLSLSQTVRRIKGPKGTVVKLTIERTGEPEPLVIPVTRDMVSIITMRSFRDGDIGYIRMDEFNRQTAQDLFLNLRELQRNGPFKGFVLDLRFNSGGLLTQAKLIADFFLPGKREIVRTVSPNAAQLPFLSSDRMLCDVPMIVMVSPGSASAAEIIAGALQLNGRAVVTGSPTFGKGSVQTLTDLKDDSRLKITIQEYQLANGVSIQEHGVVPDVMLLQHTTDEQGEIDMVPNKAFREGDNEYALKDQGTYTIDSAYSLGWLAPWRSRADQRLNSLSSPDFRPDPQASMIIELLDSAVHAWQDDQVRQALLDNSMRIKLLQRLEQPIVERSVTESDKLAQALLEHHDITWGTGDQIPAGTIQGRYLGPNEIAPGSSVDLRFALDNLGDQAAGRLYGLARADDGSPFWGTEVIFGEVPAGGSVEKQITFAVPPRWYQGQESFELVIYQEGGLEELAVIPVSLLVDQVSRPSLSYEWQLIEPGGDGVLSADESVVLRLTFSNLGMADSFPLLVYVFKNDDHFVQLGEARFQVPAVPAGGQQVVDVPISLVGSVKRGRRDVVFEGDSVELQVRAEEDFGEDVRVPSNFVYSRYRAGLFDSLDVPVGKPAGVNAVSQPIISVHAIDRRTDHSAVITFGVADDNLDQVAVFVGDNKVALVDAQDFAGGDSQSIAVDVAQDEVTQVRLVASDHDEVTEVYPIRLFPVMDELAQAALPTDPAISGDSQSGISAAAPLSDSEIP